MGAIATQPLSSWNLGVRQVVTVPNTEQTMSALVELHRNKITGIGIINPETKCLVGNVSITDLKDMETGNNLRKMFIPLETFLQNKVEGQGVRIRLANVFLITFAQTPISRFPVSYLPLQRIL
jgi:CBS-domain-containing membrane protein